MRYRTPEDRGPRQPTRYDFEDDPRDRMDGMDRMDRLERDDEARFNESRFSESRFNENRHAHPYQSRYDYDLERERWSSDLGRSGARHAGSYGALSYGGYGGYGATPRAPGGRIGRGPKGYTRSDDRIFDDVCDRIGMELDASDVEVSVSNGEVTLIGTVGDRQTKYEMEEIVDRVGGVKQVHNHIMVRRLYHGDERVPSDVLPRKPGGSQH